MKIGVLIPPGVDIVVIRHGDGAHGAELDRLLVVPGALNTFPDTKWVKRDVLTRLKDGVEPEHLE